MAVIDANAALADRHRSGVLVEELTVISLVQTLSANVPALTASRFWSTARSEKLWLGTPT